MAIALVTTLDLVVEPSRVLESCAGFLDVAALETAGRGIERGAEVEEAVVSLGLGEQRDPFGRGAEGDAVPGQARIPNAIARRLTGAGRAEQHDVLATGQEVELAEVLDQRRLDRALEPEVELLERLAGGAAGGLDAALAAVRLARGVLGRQQRLGEAGWE
jgi:hypothetical protein